MDWLEGDLEDARVLELFAGTGAVGLEALSRGARSVDFVENGSSALHSLKANLAALRVQQETRLFKRDAVAFAERLSGPVDGVFPYDVVLLDPPYQSRAADRVVSHWLKENFSRVLAVETAPDHELPGKGKRRILGEAAVTVYRSRRG
jgi:16S rRNA (guanine966-N2)-methyltransferase